MSECSFFCCGFWGFLKNASTVYCVFCLRLILPVVFSACCTAVKLVNHITVLLFLYLACLHYSTYWLCIINTKSTFSTERRALGFFLMRAVVQTAKILFQEQIQSITVCGCINNEEPLLENTSFSSQWMEERFPYFKQKQ